MGHMLHLELQDEGFTAWDLECVNIQTCEHTYVFTHDGEVTCSLVEWFDNVGQELLGDGEHVFPVNPSFPMPVRPVNWGNDGPQLIYDKDDWDRDPNQRSFEL